MTTEKIAVFAPIPRAIVSNDDSGKDRRASHRPQRVTRIARSRPRARQPALIAQRVHRLRGAASGDPRRPRGVPSTPRRCARSAASSRCTRKLLLEIGVRASLSHGTPEAGRPFAEHPHRSRRSEGQPSPCRSVWMIPAIRSQRVLLFAQRPASGRRSACRSAPAIRLSVLPQLPTTSRRCSRRISAGYNVPMLRCSAPSDTCSRRRHDRIAVEGGRAS